MVCNLILETINASVMMCIPVLLRRKKFDFFLVGFESNSKLRGGFKRVLTFTPTGGKWINWVSSTTD